MTSPSAPLTTVYATDEDIAVRAGGDYVLLCPRWQKLAQANDGAFTATAGGSWVLNSASAAFQASAIQTGNVVWITGNTSTFKGSGELFGIDSVTPTSVTLHRVGVAAGVGMPPGPAAGVTALQYTLLTFYPQIENASFLINRTYHIDPNVPRRTPADMSDLRDLRDCCVLMTIVQRLVAEVQDFRNGAWAAKLDNYRQSLDSITDRLQIRWSPNESVIPSTNWFSTRLVR